jgi:phytoene/squalene synthetase
MNNTTARLARRITWASSKQSYLTARLLADRDLADDCLRAYAYFRWADDMIDISLTDRTARAAFIERQKALIDSLYRGERPNDLSPEEAMLADLIAHDRFPESGLASFIRNFMAVIELDAHRQGRLASRADLQSYTTCLASAVMDGLQYFIGNGQPYPRTHNRLLAVTGAHIMHMLRDTCEDLPAGLVNIPAEYLEAHGMQGIELNSEPLRAWVREQVVLARMFFEEGKIYIDSLEVLRCKLAGVWYCARFECVLELIERDGYWLRANYPERHGLKVWLEMVRLGVVVTLKHVAGRFRTSFYRLNPPAGLNSRWNTPSYRVK